MTTKTLIGLAVLVLAGCCPVEPTTRDVDALQQAQVRI